MTSRVKRLLATLFVIATLLLFGRFFASQLSSGDNVAGPPGVVLAPPPDVFVEELGEASRSEAADRLLVLLSRSDSLPFAVHFYPGGSQELYWILDRQGREELLIERRSGPGNTRVETRWRGAVAERLAWTQANGTPEASHLAAGESTNLYH